MGINVPKRSYPGVGSATLIQREQQQVAVEEFNQPILCPHCDLLVKIETLQAGEKADCPRCGTTLLRYWQDAHQKSIGYAASTLLMLVLALIFPFISIRLSGIYSQIMLIDIPQTMFKEHYGSIGTLFIVLVQLVPAFCMVSILIVCTRYYVPINLQKRLAKILFMLKPWCMVEIFLTGVLVSFVKLMAYGEIGLGLSFVPYVLFCMLQIKAFYSVDVYRLWQKIEPHPTMQSAVIIGKTGLEQGLRSCECCMAVLPELQRKCPRCHTEGYSRKKNSLQWTLAFLLTAVFLYVPSNVLPIMTTVALGSQLDSTILSGVLLLWDDGSYPVAIIIFIASIAIPCLKILSIACLCLFASGKLTADKELMQLLYNAVEFVGRWSMIDIFVITILATLLKIGQFMSVYAALGALCFASVVILTMISARYYDPRLIWDRKVTLSKKEAVSGRTSE